MRVFVIKDFTNFKVYICDGRLSFVGSKTLLLSKLKVQDEVKDDNF